jgi:hypothetical protein
MLSKSVAYPINLGSGSVMIDTNISRMPTIRCGQNTRSEKPNIHGEAAKNRPAIKSMV